MVLCFKLVKLVFLFFPWFSSQLKGWLTFWCWGWNILGAFGIRSKLWLLMTWLLTLPGHQPPKGWRSPCCWTFLSRVWTAYLESVKQILGEYQWGFFLLAIPNFIGPFNKIHSKIYADWLQNLFYHGVQCVCQDLLNCIDPQYDEFLWENIFYYFSALR